MKQIAAEFDIEPIMPRTSEEDRFLATKLQGLSNDIRATMYAVNDLTVNRKYDKEATFNATGEGPATLAGTLDCINPTLYRNVNTILTILFTMPVSTATPERSFSTMRRVKTYLRATRQRHPRLLL